MKTLCKILIVDDELDILNFYSSYFSKRGFLVKKASNGKEGVEKLRQERFEVAIVDIRMPEMSGIELAQHVQVEGIDTRLIILTGFGAPDEVTATTKAGVHVVFYKDKVVPNELLYEVNKLLPIKRYVFVEGKTDVAILRTAWDKLNYKQPLPFIIKEIDPLAGLDGGAGGAKALSDYLSSIPVDNSFVGIGMFDQDDEGIKRYNKLHAYFDDVATLKAKVSKSDKAAAFLLPVPRGKENYEKFRALSIEFYFSESALLQRTSNGLGLNFRYHPEITLLRGIEKLKQPSTAPEARDIISGKVVFANEIVPKLSATEFEPFRLVFEKIRDLFIYIENS
ncbi:response regulator [Anaerolineales bacterium HSG24]|nr:response regulator [Anaerolineales bacterium HSG24]